MSFRGVLITMAHCDFKYISINLMYFLFEIKTSDCEASLAKVCSKVMCSQMPFPSRKSTHDIFFPSYRVSLRSIEPVNYCIVDLSHPMQGGRTDKLYNQAAVMDSSECI